jgi:hypothetical protein
VTKLTAQQTNIYAFPLLSPALQRFFILGSRQSEVLLKRQGPSHASDQASDCALTTKSAYWSITEATSVTSGTT